MQFQISTPAIQPGLTSLFDAPFLSGDDPERDALILFSSKGSPRRISQRSLREHCLRAASALSRRGIGSDDVIIITHTDEVEAIFAFWACVLLGAIPSMFHSVTEKIKIARYSREIPPLVAQTRARAAIASSEFAPQLAELIDCEVISFDDLAGQALDRIPPPSSPPKKIALLQHSSGTTGAKKGVALSHTAIVRQIAAYSSVLEIRSTDVIASWLPLYHDAGMIAGHILPLLQGLPLILMSPFDWVSHPSILFGAIDQFGATLCWLPNFAYNHLSRRVRDRDVRGLSLSSVRAFVNMSEPVRAHSHDQFFRRFHTLGLSRESLTSMYGMAENVLAVTQTPIGRPPKNDWIYRKDLELMNQARIVEPGSPDATAVVSCGYPIPGVSVAVTSESGDALGERKVGEIVIHSDHMFDGYYRRPNLNSAIRDGWYFTGDLGYIAEGELYVTGRSSDMIVHGGRNIYPADIEDIVNQIDGVHPGRVVVFGVDDETEGTQLIAVLVEVDRSSAPEPSNLKKEIRREIAAQSSVTATYVDVFDRGWLIKTSSGKISRRANKDKWLDGWRLNL